MLICFHYLVIYNHQSLLNSIINLPNQFKLFPNYKPGKKLPKTNNFFAKSGHTCNEQEKGRRSESNVKFLYSDNFHKLYSLQSGKQQALNTNLDNVIFTNPFSKMTFLRRFRPSVLDASTILDVVMLDLRRHRGHRWDGPRFEAGRSRPSASP